MIPYDDLVSALSAWRARQGLPVSQLAGAAAAPAPAPAPAAAKPAPAPAPAARTAPPAGPPSRITASGAAVTPQGRPVAAPAKQPAAVHEDSIDVEDSSFLEESSSDFAMSFGNPGGEPGESTAVGVGVGASRAPADVELDDLPASPPGPRRGGHGR
jgi:hypothetical protein